jgi:flagellar assembly protein FliH
MSSSRIMPPPPAPSHWALEELGAALDHTHLMAPSDEPLQIDVHGVERDAYARGYQDGQLAGVQAESARLQAALAALDDAMLQLHGEAEQWVANARENVCALAIAVARQILQREVPTDPAVVAELALRALNEVPVEQPVVIRLHPDDLALLDQLAADAHGSRAALSGDRAEVQWLADPRVVRGGCLLESRDRIIDGRIDAGLERLYRRLSATDA